MHKRYYANNKKIVEYEKENETIPERHVCENCHREHKEEGNEFYHLSFIEQDEANILGRKKFKDPTAFSDLSRESFKLCLECNQYLTQTADEIVNEASVTWCSYIWTVLKDEFIHEKYGEMIWRFIPVEWRPWWIDVLKEKFPFVFGNITITKP